MIKGEKEKAIQYANIAIESDPIKIAEKIKNDSAFITILSKLTIPLNLENLEEKECNLSEKYKKAKEHLEKTSEIARNIGYDDIRLLEYKKNKDENNINLQETELVNSEQELNEKESLEEQKEIEE